MKDNELPKRKHIRLKEFDYSSDGAYFVTICTNNKCCTLSRIVGRGLAPAENEHTLLGKIAEEQLKLLEKRYSFLTVDKYVIMPNHIHVILIFDKKKERNFAAAGASPRPTTLMDVVCAYKSLTVRECRKHTFNGKIFQDSFYEHIIRGQNDYDEIAKYISENPMRWCYDKLYIEE